MNDQRISADIAEIKAIIREFDRRQQSTELEVQKRMTNVEAGITEIRADVAKIAKRDEVDHDEIVRMRTQMTIRPAIAAVVSTIVSVIAAYLGLRPPSQ